MHSVTRLIGKQMGPNMKLATTAPMLPLPVQAICLCILFGFFFVGLRNSQSRSATFILIAIWLRLIIANLHAWTFARVFAGMSIQSLTTIFMVFLGFFLIRKRLIVSWMVIPFLPFIASIGLSGALNNNFKEGLDTMMRILFCIILTLHCFEAIRRSSHRNLTFVLLCALSPSIVYGVAAILFRVGKFSEFDSSTAYVGGYNHESSYSMVLIAVLFVLILSKSIKARWNFALFMVTIALLFLANYRTAIIACGPAVLFYFVSMITTWIPRSTRALLTMSLGALLVGSAGLLTITSDRFSDVTKVFESMSAYGIKEPAELSLQDRKLMSGRFYLWSQYYNGWSTGDDLHKIVGFGPDAWKERFPLYAHNSFIHYLFETGILGFTSLIFLFGSMVLASLSATSTEKIRLVSLNLSFLILNMATMPLFQVEGLVALGIVWGWTSSYVFLRTRNTHYLAPQLHHSLLINRRI